MDPEINKLLQLQEEDGKRIDTERQLAAFPKQLQGLENLIAEERKKQQDAQQRLKSMEAQRGLMRTERLAAEEQIIKYKTQQMQVKKNDEYTALTHEIERLSQKASEREEEEIALLLEIDELALTVRKEVAAAEQRIAETSERVTALKSHDSTLKNELKHLMNTIEAISKTIDPKYLRAYENVRQRYKRPPFVMPIIDRKVGGLRVSGEVETAARKAEGVVTDENSGRIVYYPDL